MDKITIEEYFQLLIDPESTDVLIGQYSIIQKGAGGFDFNLAPNPDKVELTQDDVANEDAMRVGNGLARWRRYQQFKKKRRDNPNQKILISEGDSWFQFPVLIKDTIDQLKNKYIIRSLGAAGDTLANMVNGPEAKKSTEYLNELENYGEDVGAFLFSGAGNDIIGEDADTGEPVLFGILNEFNNDVNDVLGQINSHELSLRIRMLKQGYEKLIHNIRSLSGFETLPLVFHGYDYVIPYPAAAGEHRKPIYAEKDQWLGKALKNRNIVDTSLQFKIMQYLIDALYDMLFELEQTHSDIHIIDCRGAVGGVADWADEIHPTDKGFTKVAERFDNKLTSLGLV